MYGYTEELEEITDQEATEKDRYFRVRKKALSELLRFYGGNNKWQHYTRLTKRF